MAVEDILYGCEVYGQKQYDDLEITQRRYIKWTLGLTRGTRTGLLMAETKRTPVWLTTTQRARKYEDRMMTGQNDLLKECIRWKWRNEPRNDNMEDWEIKYRNDLKMDYTNAYKPLHTEETPWYLTKGIATKLVARFRPENEE